MNSAPTKLSPEEKFIQLIQLVRSGREPLGQGVEVVKELLEAGGFVITSVSKDKVYGRELVDQDESRSYVANPKSGYKVVDQFGTTEPSSWLEMFWLQVDNLIRTNRSHLALGYLLEQLAICRPLAPVVVNEYGEMLRETYRQAGDKRSTDESNLDSSVIHPLCNGYTDIMETTPNNKVILCRRCKLRIYIPKSVTTWGDLRKHFAMYNP